jgi:hypothetical protein
MTIVHPTVVNGCRYGDEGHKRRKKVADMGPFYLACMTSVEIRQPTRLCQSGAIRDEPHAGHLHILQRSLVGHGSMA